MDEKEFTFNPKYINALNDLKDKIYKWLQDNKNLAEEIKIKNKVIGFLGEVLVVTELYDEFKDKLNEKECKWVGGQKKEYDIQLYFKDSSKPIKIQVKSTTDKDTFSILKLKLGDRKEKIIKEIDEEYKQLKPDLLDFKLPKEFQDKIDEEIGKNEANFWILNDLSGMKPLFFILKKEEINQLLKDDYRGYQIERKIKESKGERVSKKYNYGINKEGVLWFRLHKKWDEKYFKNKLNDSKYRWDKISSYA